MCPNQVAEKDVDYELPVKLATDENKAAIFNWLLEGYKAFVANKGRIELSESIKSIREDIKADANSARRWVREKGYKPLNGIPSTDQSWKPINEWMQDYLAWCKECSENPKTAKAVGAVLKDLGFASEKRRSTTWYCIGKPAEECGIASDIIGDNSGDLPF